MFDQVVVIGDNRKYLAALVILRRDAVASENSVGDDSFRLIEEFRAFDHSLCEHERALAIGVLHRPFVQTRLHQHEAKARCHRQELCILL